jgi:hypothetical protein
MFRNKKIYDLKPGTAGGHLKTEINLKQSNLQDIE